MSISEADLREIIQLLDRNGDGVVHEHEFKDVYLQVFPHISEHEFQQVWSSLDENRDGELSLEELARHYGYDLVDLTDEGMTDEKILELLEVQSKLAEMQRDAELKRNPPKTAETTNRRNSRGLGYGPSLVTEAERKAAGVTTIKMTSVIRAELHLDENASFLDACEFKDAEKIDSMLESTTLDVRIEDEKGEMPLHKLARGGLLRQTRSLLSITPKLHDDLNWQDKQGKTPLMLAAEYNHPEIVNELLDLGADAMMESSNGGTALHLAVATKSEAAIIAMLSHSKVDRTHLVDVPDRNGRTPLHIAAFSENENMTRVLIDHGAHPLTDAYDNTPAKLAGKAGRRNSKDMLDALEKLTVR